MPSILYSNRVWVSEQSFLVIAFIGLSLAIRPGNRQELHYNSHYGGPGFPSSIAEASILRIQSPGREAVVCDCVRVRRHYRSLENFGFSIPSQVVFLDCRYPQRFARSLRTFMTKIFGLTLHKASSR